MGQSEFRLVHSIPQGSLPEVLLQSAGRKCSVAGAFKCPQGQPRLGTTESGVVCAKDTRRSGEGRGTESDEQPWKPLKHHGLGL